MPPSIAASLEPVVDVPVASSSSGEFHKRASMFTQRISRSAVRGYSSLSIMFLSNVSAISVWACGSIHVVTNVARFSRALPSSISSSCTTWYAVSGRMPTSGITCVGAPAASPARAKIGSITDRCSIFFTSTGLTDLFTLRCSAMTLLQLVGIGATTGPGESVPGG